MTKIHANIILLLIILSVSMQIAGAGYVLCATGYAPSNALRPISAALSGGGQDVAKLIGGLEYLGPIAAEMLNVYGSAERLRGLNVLELGTVDAGNHLFHALKRLGVNMNGVGGNARDGKDTRSGSYDAYLASIPPDSLDLIYSFISLYPMSHREAGGIINPSAKDGYGYNNPFPHISRVLKPGGFLITTHYASEIDNYLTDAELELLGLEKVRQYSVKEYPSEIVTLLMKRYDDISVLHDPYLSCQFSFPANNAIGSAA